jgi:hypothetical protein
MGEIKTLGDLLHNVANSLSIISSYSQYLLGKREASGIGGEDLDVIRDEAHRAAELISLVPRRLGQTTIYRCKR